MSDELSDPQASSAHSPSPTESIPPPDEPKTPVWLTIVGLGLFLVVLAWAAVRCGSDARDAEVSPSGAAAPVATAGQ